VSGTVVARTSSLNEVVGTHLGWSSWRILDQARIWRFADVIDDHQWVHLDPERAKDGPFGTTVAHGFLTLALATALLSEVLRADGASLVVNYGLNRVRFPAPAPSGSRVRMGAELADVDGWLGGVQATLALTFEVKAQPRPVCVAELVFCYLG
jgi:acyl dehydratase